MSHSMRMSSSYEENTNNCSPKNKMFTTIHEAFLNNDWNMRENTMTTLSYYNPIAPMDEFKIKMENKIIYVTFPLTPGNYEYTANFTSYFLAMWRSGSALGP